MAENVTILIPTALRPFAGNKEQVQLAGATVGEVLGQLTGAYADLKKHLYNDSGQLRSRLFLLDGSSMRLEHTAALKKAYPLEPVVWGDEGIYGVSLLGLRVVLCVDVVQPAPILEPHSFKGPGINGLPAARDFGLVPDTTLVKSILVY